MGAHRQVVPSSGLVFQKSHQTLPKDIPLSHTPSIFRCQYRVELVRTRPKRLLVRSHPPSRTPCRQPVRNRAQPQLPCQVCAEPDTTILCVSLPMSKPNCLDSCVAGSARRPQDGVVDFRISPGVATAFVLDGEGVPRRKGPLNPVHDVVTSTSIIQRPSCVTAQNDDTAHDGLLHGRLNFSSH